MHCTGCGRTLRHLPPIVCDACGTAHWRDPKPCASGLVTNEGRLLPVQRAHDPWRGCWDTPGGFCNVDEHPILTAEREVLEETGLAIKITGVLGMWIDHYGPSEDRASRKTTLNIYFHAVPLDEPRLQIRLEEVAAISWFRPEELPHDLAFPDHIVPVLDAWRRAFLANDLVSALLDRPTAARH
jgi:ADP-ribose pyrophosphatase YjhB (NUDIX family)